MTGDFKYWKTTDGKIIEVPPINELCNMLKSKFIDQDADNVRLEEEITKLKNGIFEKEEIARLKEIEHQYYHNSFHISDEEREAIKNWMNTHEKRDTGTIGGRYEYRFFPTSIGDIGKVVDTITGDEFVFRELS